MSAFRNFTLTETRLLNPGLCQHQCRIWKPIKTKDDFGADVITNGLYATVWAQVVALQGRELEAAQQKYADAAYLIRMPYISGIEREYTIEWLSRGITMDVVDVQDPAGAADFTQIYAKDHLAR